MSKWFCIILIFVLVVVVSGCSYLPSTEPYQSVGLDKYRGHGSLLSREASMRRVESPLKLSKAIEIALENNPGIGALRYDIGAAGARKDVAVGEVLPKVSGIGDYNRFLDNQRLIPAHLNGEQGVFSNDIFTAGLVLNMPLFTGGKLISEIEAAKLLKKATEHRLARSREELIFNVSSTFYSILAQRHVIESVKFSQKTLEEHLKRVEELIAVQKAAKVDRLRTEVRLADLKQQLVREKNTLAILERVLTNLLGVKDTLEPIVVQGKLEFSRAGEQPVLDKALAVAFQHREDYLAARAELEAQARNVDVALAARWPTVSMQGAYGGRWAADPSEKPDGKSSSEDEGRVGVTVNLPIFQGGQIKARIREQKAKLATAQERLRELKLQIRLDVQTALLNVASSRERILATQKAVEQAKESLRIEEEKYNFGKGSIIDVLDAQLAMLDSQTNYYRALAEQKTALAQLRLAEGKEK